jgi:putative tryptophan/tyrosine transport system substrate-binding protein
MMCLIGALAAMGPIGGLAQPSTGRRRVGLMVATAENDDEGKLRAEAFRRALSEAGWIDGRNVDIDVAWFRGSFELAQTMARELVDRGAEVLVANGTPAMDAVRALGTNLPVVFVVVSNPVGAGYVPNLARPGANVTGFSTFEPEIAGKWVELLREAAPTVQNVSMLLDPKLVSFQPLLKVVQDLAPALGFVAHAAYAGTLEEIERAVALISKQTSPGLIVSPSPINTVNRQRLISIANEARIPAIFPFRFYVREGALLAYGFNTADQFKRSGEYVARILRGEKAGDLPVQTPSLFELGVNLKTAKALGLTLSQSLLLSANEVVE